MRGFNDTPNILFYERLPALGRQMHVRAVAGDELEVPALVERPEPNAVLGIQRLQAHRDDRLRHPRVGLGVLVGRCVGPEPAALFRHDHGVLPEEHEDQLVESLEVLAVGLVY